jgi:hypothetical protein
VKSPALEFSRDRARAALDSALSLERASEPVSREIVDECTALFSDYLEVLQQVHGVLRSLDGLPLEDRADYYVEATKLSLFNVEEHGGWPIRSDVRRGLVPELSERMRAGADPWTCAALVLPALLDNQLLLARRAYERACVDDLAGRVVLQWCEDAMFEYPHLHDLPMFRRFVAATRRAPSDEPMTPAERWAVHATIYPSPVTDPRTRLADSRHVPRVGADLEGGWGVSSSEEARAVITRVSSAGHRAAMVRMLNNMVHAPPEYRGFLGANVAALRRTEILAWDLCRVISVARSSLAVGYLTRDEASELILQAARRLQYTYGSWEEMGADYKLGAIFFNISRDKSRFHLNIVDSLIEDPASGWRTVPWATPLT